MRILYEAFDGNLFYEEYECRKYEKMRSHLKMWNRYGMRVETVADAWYALCVTEEDTQIIMDLAKQEFVEVAGIQLGRTGLYYWDDDDGAFKPMHISYEEADALAKVLADAVRRDDVD
jgi:hypothetical protein